MNLPSGAPTVTARAVLLTDVVGSVDVSARLGDAAAAEFWRLHHRLARDLVRRWHGQEIDSSDGFLLLFPGVAEALGFAGAYHRSIASLTPALQARAGLHFGPVQVRENELADRNLGAKPVEVEGMAKMIAARAMSIARGGQTLLTGPAREALHGLDARIESRGHWRVKGIDEPLELFEAADEASDLEPPAETAKAYRVVRKGDVWLPLHDVGHSLPAERDAFVGRQPALRELCRRFDAGARLVSLVGTGGVGKTRLAQRFGWVVLGDHPGGVWFCDLSQARTPDSMCFAVAQGLDMTLGPADAPAQLGEALAGRAECLLILDNFEQVTPYGEATVGQWLERAPKARFLVTSRESLGVAGEEVMRLDTLADADARELFLQRAESAGGSPPASDEESASITRLVELLDGLPLAIELAAARAGTIPVSMLVRRMHERFELLVSKGGRRTRQATLRAAIDWSWELLSAKERLAFAQLSVAEGSCSLDAAEAIIDLRGEGAAGSAGEKLDVLQSLVDRSLVRLRADGRYDMLVSLRAYAAERLAQGAAGETDVRLPARQRHCTWFAHLRAEQAAGSRGIELDNLLAACRFAIATRQAALAVGALEGAWLVLDRRGPFREAIELAREIGRLEDIDEASRARVELVQGSALRSAGDLAAAQSALESALARSRRSGAGRVQRRSLAVLGDVHLVGGRVEEARRSLEEAMSLARSAADVEVQCIVLGHLGNIAENIGDMDEAFRNYEASLDLALRTGDVRRQGGALGNLGLVLHYQGRHAEARKRYEQALALARDVGDRQWEGNTLCNLGLLLHEQGALIEARTALESALSVAAEMGHARLAAVARCNLGILLEASGERDEATLQFEAAVALAKRLGDRRSEGQFLGYLGVARARQGRFDRASACLEEGERLLREVADRSNLAMLLCQRAEADCLRGDVSGARSRLDEARQLSLSTGAGADSELVALLERTGAEIARIG